MNAPRLLSAAILFTSAGYAACSSSGSPATGNDGGSALHDAGSGNDAGVGADGGNPGDDSGGGDDGGSGDDSANQSTEFDATLSGAELASPVVTTATGTGKFMLASDNVTLSYDITLSVQNPTAASLHIGAPGENGAVAHSLAPVSAHMTGQVMLSAVEADALAAGLLYIDVQTQANPTGALRGQLVTPGSTIFVASASGAQEVPAVTSSCHAHASFILNAARDTARYHFATDCTPTDVNMKKAIASMSGPVAFPLAPISQTIDGTLTLATTDADDLEQGHWYLDVLTTAHPSGEVRGQVMKPGEVLYASALSGATCMPPVNTTATGGAQAIAAADRKSLRYEVIVSGIIPVSIELDNGMSGANGPTMYSLTLAGSGAVGNTNITANDASLLQNRSVYMNVKTASYPNGELRGQLSSF